MRAWVLLSAGRHPTSGKALPPRAEWRAARLAAALDPDAGGLHAGPAAEAVTEVLGRGLTHITHLRLGSDADPLPALAAALAAERPDVTLAGPRAEGGADSGLLPYALAHALDWPLVASAVALEPAPEGLRVTQALPQGARRLVTVRTPALIVVHPGAPAPLPFAHGRARTGRVTQREADAAPPAPSPEGETRPWRARPKAMRAQSEGSGGGRVLVNPDPQDAAREILAFLREIGVVAPREGGA